MALQAEALREVFASSLKVSSRRYLMPRMQRALVFLSSILLCFISSQIVQSEVKDTYYQRIESLVVEQGEVRIVQIERIVVDNDVIVRDGGKLRIIGSQCTVGNEIRVEEGAVLEILDSYIGMGCHFDIAGSVVLNRVKWTRFEDSAPPYIVLSGRSSLTITRSAVCGSEEIPAVSGVCDSISIANCQLVTWNTASFIDVTAKKYSFINNEMRVSLGDKKDREAELGVCVFRINSDYVTIRNNSVVVSAACRVLYWITAFQECVVSGELIRTRTGRKNQMSAVIQCNSPSVSIADNTIWGYGYSRFISIEDCDDFLVSGNRCIGAFEVFGVIVVRGEEGVVSGNAVLGADECYSIMYILAKKVKMAGNSVQECVVESVYVLYANDVEFTDNTIDDCRGVSRRYELRDPNPVRRRDVWIKDRHSWDLLVLACNGDRFVAEIADNTVKRCITMRVCLLLGDVEADMYVRQIMSWSLSDNTIDVVIEVEKEWSKQLADEAFAMAGEGNTIGKFVGHSRGIRPLMDE